MIKEEKIKEAYGENYNPHNIDENGWMKYSLWMHFFKKVDADYDEFDNINMVVRPNSLTGIENNNGWIKIENEKILFEKPENCLFEWYNIFDKRYDVGEHFNYGVFTHFKVIPEPQKELPLYQAVDANVKA